MLYGVEELTLDFRALLSCSASFPHDKGVVPDGSGGVTERLLRGLYSSRFCSPILLHISRRSEDVMADQEEGPTCFIAFTRL